jgi:endoglycosylceramidase
MHQDLFSMEFSDGAPKWATIDQGKPHNKGTVWSDWEVSFGADASLLANFSQIPEPSTGIMLMLGMAVIMFTGGRTTVSKPIR